MIQRRAILAQVFHARCESRYSGPVTEQRWNDLTPSELALLALIVLVGAALRVHWNNVPRYSPADEQYYVNYTRHLVDAGWWNYPALIRNSVDVEANWLFTSVLRWGYFLFSASTCHLMGRCDARTLAWLSTAAGVVSIPLTFAIGLETLGARSALLAAALSCTSPLQLALGRRALTDELFCTVCLALLWCIIRLARSEASRPAVGLYALSIIAATLALAIKESLLLMYPAYVAVLALSYGRRGFHIGDVLFVVLPPLFFFLGFCLLSRSVSDFFDVTRIFVLQGNLHNPYLLQYQSGPPHRGLFDLFILAPLVCLLATGAVAMIAHPAAETDRGARWLALFLVVMLGVFALVPSRNVRNIIVADPIIRLLAAWCIVKYQLAPRNLGLMALGALALANAAAELPLFHTIFITSQVYDPVTYNLLYALGALPRP